MLSPNDAHLDLDVDEVTAEMLLEYGFLAETSAEILTNEIRSIIPDAPGPSEPGRPPHSPGPLRDSFHTSRAKRRGDRVTAWTFSLARAANGESLPELLDRGGRAAPRPFLDQAEIAASAKLDAAVARESAR